MLQKATMIARYAPIRLRSMTIRSGSNGAAARASITANAISNTPLAMNIAMVNGALQLFVSALDKP
jgi:hypothetical protein